MSPFPKDDKLDLLPPKIAGEYKILSKQKKERFLGFIIEK